MLRVTLVCVGRIKAGAERDLAARYIERAKTCGRGIGLEVSLREVDESRARRAEDRKAEEATAILAVVAPGTRLVAFDEAGRALDSPSFAKVFDAAKTSASGVALIVGGPDGLDPTLRETASLVLAFGAMTWPHQLVRIMAGEQIYRAITILSGHPYHRA